MFFNKKFYAYILIACFFSANVKAQLDNKIFAYDLPINGSDSNKLFFGLNTLNYLRNTEYFGPIESGKTTFGYFLNPKLTYYPTSLIRIDFGGFFRKDFGNDKFKMLTPTFSVKVSKNGYSAIFGNYEAAMCHRLIEPLFNVEYAITKPLENGFQFKIDKKRLFSDTWIDWQKMIYNASPFKEEIMAGTSNLFTVIGAENNFKTSIAYQAVIRHVGGQIDALRNTPLLTDVNMATGLRLSYHFEDSSFFKELRSDNYVVAYSESSSAPVNPYKNGSGMYFNLLLKTKLISLMASYWNAGNYVATNGTPIYQSINSVDFNQALARVPKRELLFLRFFYEKNLAKDLNLDVRFEPFYEFNRNTVDFSYSVYLRYNLNVKLANIKSLIN